MRERLLGSAITILAVVMGLYHLIYTQYLLQEPIEHQDTHLAFALVIVFLLQVKDRPRSWPLMLGLMIPLSLISTGYIKVFYNELVERPGFPITADVVIGFILLLVTLEACRRSFGWILPILAVIMAIYSLLGHLIPGPMGHTELSVARYISAIVTGFSGLGIFGTLLGISANYIFLFMLFSGLLQASGALDFFLQGGRLVGRHIKSGPAQTAVVASGLVGMVSGQATSNVALTGSFTIPLMKKAGYKPETAAAIEAAASSGGQIMPPIMGAAAFVMAGFIGVPYFKIMIAAVIPALLYFVSVGMFVHLQAMKENLGSSAEEVDTRQMLVTGPLFIIPLLLLTVLLVRGYSPMFSAFWAIVCLFLVSLPRRETRLTARRLVDGFTMGARTGAQIAVATATLGPILAMATHTGIAIKISSLVEIWSGGNLLVALIITMVASVFLGTGLPTVAAYSVVAIVIAPALVRMGVEVFQAHFFGFIFATFSALTPPVGVASIVASKMAGASYMRTSYHAVRAGFAAYIVPFLLIWNGNLLLRGDDPVWGVTSIVAVVAALWGLQAGFSTHYLRALRPWEIGLAFLSSATLFAFAAIENYFLFIAGLLLLLFLTLWQIKRPRDVTPPESTHLHTPEPNNY
jgi:TRAP transporter 4TM/12TM fusion protein